MATAQQHHSHTTQTHSVRHKRQFQLGFISQWTKWIYASLCPKVVHHHRLSWEHVENSDSCPVIPIQKPIQNSSLRCNNASTRGAAIGYDFHVAFRLIGNYGLQTLICVWSLACFIEECLVSRAVRTSHSTSNVSIQTLSWKSVNCFILWFGFR